jgi:hypothetical protein
MVVVARLNWVIHKPNCVSRKDSNGTAKAGNLMDSDTTVAVRFGTPGNVLEVQVGTVEVDVPRSIGYFGGIVAALGLGLIEPPLALFIAAVPVFKALTNTDLPRAVRVVGEVLEGAAKPVGSDAEGVIQLRDQKAEQAQVAKLNPKTATKRATR